MFSHSTEGVLYEKKTIGSLVIAGSVMCGLAFADDGHSKTYQTTNVFQFGAPAVKLGAASLIRSRQNLEMRIGTNRTTGSKRRVHRVVGHFQ